MRRNAPMRVCVNATGYPLPIYRMSDGHLENAIRYVRYYGVGTFQHRAVLGWLLDEYKYRKKRRPTPLRTTVRGATKRKEVRQMIRAGRIILNPAHVASVLSDGRKGVTVVTLSSDTKHTFKKYADAVWAKFKREAGTGLSA